MQGTGRRRKILGRVLVSLLLVVVALHVGGGWFVSGMIREGSLQVLHYPDPPADDPADVGVEFQEVSYDAGLGPTPAWIVPGSRTAAKSEQWVILIHGRGGVRADWLHLVVPLYEAGYTSLVISYRNDPDAPADPSGEYGLGRTEWPDAAAAVDLALASGAQRVVLLGASMGGGMIAAYLQQGAAPQVVGLVLDAPLLNLSNAVDLGAQSLGYPVPPTLLWTAKQLASWRFGLSWPELDYLHPSDYLTVPTLLIHGTADTVVPFADSEQLAADHPDLVTLVQTGADHGGSWREDPERYNSELLGYLDRVLA